MQKLDDVIAEIKHPDTQIEPEVQAHLDDLTKPRGSLGRLEEIALRYCLIHGTTQPKLGKKRICCFAGDHGVAAEGVSAYPAEVTPQMVMNMIGGGAAINVLSRHVGADLVVVDMGVNDPLENVQGLCRMKVRSGAANIAEGPAMSTDEATTAVMHGVELACRAAEDGVTLLGTGDMGIANTTPATALLAAYLGCPVDSITGRGTGIDDATMKKKISVIEKALDVNKDRMTDPLATLAAVGGMEIAGICGLVLGGAAQRIPVVVDGFISTSGAAAACAMKAEARDYLFFSHLSHEHGHRKVLDSFGIKPILDLDMRLGEGTGAALAISIIEAAVKTYNEMATFSSAGVSDHE